MRFRFDNTLNRIKILSVMTHILNLLLGLLILQTSLFGWIEVSKRDGDQWQPTAAYLNNQFIIGWSDTRDLITDTSSNIYACRITSNGTILDTNGILVASGRQEQLVPRVCSSNSDWLFIWQEGC
jgi:hypothetical protein